MMTFLGMVLDIGAAAGRGQHLFHLRHPAAGGDFAGTDWVPAATSVSHHADRGGRGSAGFIAEADEIGQAKT
jgi:hypothetical protein